MSVTFMSVTRILTTCSLGDIRLYGMGEALGQQHALNVWVTPYGRRVLASAVHTKTSVYIALLFTVAT